jgi:hypothetical protein
VRKVNPLGDGGIDASFATPKKRRHLSGLAASRSHLFHRFENTRRNRPGIYARRHLRRRRRDCEPSGGGGGDQSSPRAATITQTCRWSRRERSRQAPRQRAQRVT